MAVLLLLWLWLGGLCWLLLYPECCVQRVWAAKEVSHLQCQHDTDGQTNQQESLAGT
jgi:hypothetical protein